MKDQDTLRHLLNDLEQRNLDRRSFLQRATALGLSTRAMAMLLGTAGVAVPGLAGAQESGGTFTYAVTTDPETLDPQKTTNSAAYTVFDEIYSTLVYQDLDLSYKGLLAESWTTSDDNLSVTFNLRNDAPSTTARLSTQTRSNTPSSGCKTKAPVPRSMRMC